MGISILNASVKKKKDYTKNSKYTINWEFPNCPKELFTKLQNI